MSNSISLTIPLEQNALRRTITWLQGMESDLHSTPVLPPFCETANSIAEQTYVEGQEEVATVEPTEVFGCKPQPTVAQPTDTHSLDSEGMPWDGRIHTSAKTKVANGTWKLARGVDKDLVEAIKAQYLGNAPTSVTPISEPTVTQPVEHITDAAVMLPPVPPTAPTPPAPPSPPTAPTEAVNPARVLISEIGKAGIAPSAVNAACQKHGIATLQVLLTQPQMVPTIRAELGL